MRFLNGVQSLAILDRHVQREARFAIYILIQNQTFVTQIHGRIHQKLIKVLKTGEVTMERWLFRQSHGAESLCQRNAKVRDRIQIDMHIF